MVFSSLDAGYFCILEGIHEGEKIFQSALGGCVETNHEKDPSAFLIFFDIIINIWQTSIHNTGRHTSYPNPSLGDKE